MEKLEVYLSRFELSHILWKKETTMVNIISKSLTCLISLFLLSMTSISSNMLEQFKSVLFLGPAPWNSHESPLNQCRYFNDTNWDLLWGFCQCFIVGIRMSEGLILSFWWTPPCLLLQSQIPFLCTPKVLDKVKSDEQGLHSYPDLWMSYLKILAELL